MTTHAYAEFLPSARRAGATLAPEATWWRWRGHDVHIARALDPLAPTRVLVVHGAGGHSGALWPLASLLAAEGLDVAAVDLPLYGRTVSPHPERVRYDHWVDLLVDLVRAEDDGRPLILLGASIGGMLAYEVSARSNRVAAVAATCLLDPRDWRVRARMTRFGPFGILGGVLAPLARGRLATTMIPMSAVANLSRMSRNPGLSALCATDPRGGAARVPLGFLASYLRYRHTPPEKARTRVALFHPAADAWTPVALSMRVLERLASPAHVVMLRGCGHFPIEEPGLTDLLAGVLDLAATIANRPPSHP